MVLYTFLNTNKITHSRKNVIIMLFKTIFHKLLIQLFLVQLVPHKLKIYSREEYTWQKLLFKLNIGKLVNNYDSLRIVRIAKLTPLSM